jgi:hypothetical protein
MKIKCFFPENDGRQVGLLIDNDNKSLFFFPQRNFLSLPYEWLSDRLA